jgi:putative endonuclease
MAAESKNVDSLDPRRRFGNRGEDLAAVFLMSRGFKILARNWSCRLGEIDVIAEKNGVVHFVEVKTRRTRAYGNPEESITPRKLLHLRRTVEVYLAQSRATIRDYQLDALAILTLPGEAPEFHYIENMF